MNARILPCKVTDVRAVGPEFAYKFYCEHGMLKGYHRALAIVDIASSQYPVYVLDAANPDMLIELSPMQASMMHSRW